MEPAALLLGASGLLALITSPRLIEISKLAKRTSKQQCADGRERAAIREQNWYRRVDNPNLQISTIRHK